MGNQGVAGANVGKLSLAEGFDFFVPFSSSGLLITYEKEDDVRKLYNVVQNVSEAYVKGLGLSIVDIHVFDFSLKNPYKKLSQLKNHKIYTTYTNKEVVQAYDKLEEIIHYRHHQILSEEGQDIYSYNQGTEHKERYQLLLWNVPRVAEYLAQSRKVVDFIRSSQEAGVYIIAYCLGSDLEVLEGGEQKHLANFSNNLSRILDRVYMYADGQYGFEPVSEDAQKLNDLVSRYDLSYLIEDASDSMSKSITEIENALDSQSADGKQDIIRVPIGKSIDGRTPLYFSLGDNSQAYHALITGMNGTGKTVLINNIILGISEQFTAKEVRLILMDYKQGVEFQDFERLPNCEKLFLDNTDTNAARSLIDDFVKLIDERGVLFREEKVQGVFSYNEKRPDKRIPITILVIDEVQQLFSGGWSEQRHFEKQLEIVVRQGRAFGIFVILSTQSIGGTNINSDIMGQIPLRLTFKLAGRDYTKVLVASNEVPTKLNKQNYEFLYNNQSGEIEGNVIGRSDPSRNISAKIDEIISTRAADEIIRPIVYKSDSNSANAPNSSEKDSDSSRENYNSSIEDVKIKQYGVEFKPINLDD